MIVSTSPSCPGRNESYPKYRLSAANARAATLLPVVQGICRLLGDTPEERAAKKAIVIQSLVYGSMICGMFIMTAHLPNMIMVGIFDKAGFSNLNSLNWMLLQAPYLGMFALTQAWIRWHFGTRKVHIAGGVEALQKKYDDLGPMTMPEKVLLGIFALAGIMFMTGKGSFIAGWACWCSSRPASCPVPGSPCRKRPSGAPSYCWAAP